MRKLLTGCGLLASCSLLVACATTTPGLGTESGTTTLPSGLSLLDSEEDSCDGTVQIADEMVEDRYEGLRAELFVEPGENATFELDEDYDTIEWACSASDSTDVETTRCPEGTDYVRVTRASTGGDVLFECFG